MSTITAILEPDADGSIHLKLPDELRHGKVKVIATLEAASSDYASEAQAELDRQRRLLEIMMRIRERNPFKSIADPVAWQREIREDRPLPGRQ